MLSLKASLTILAILYYNSQVQSTPRIFSTVFDYNNYDLIIGKNHIRKASVVYALCKGNKDGYAFSCNVVFHAAPFHRRIPALECPVNIRKYPHGIRSEVLAVDLWSEDKVIFVWRTLISPTGISSITIRTIRMSPRCKAMDEKFVAHGREDMIPQLFIIPYEISYDVAFPDNYRCPNHFCKVTVYDNGRSAGPSNAFPNARFVHSWDPVESSSNTLLTTVGNDGEATGIVRYILLTNRGQKTLGTSTEIHNSSFSSNNGHISFCNANYCETVFPNGDELSLKYLDITPSLTKYAALYNLPNDVHLAMVCNEEENSVYRIIKIGANGQQQYSFSLTELKCEYTYQYFTAKFYKAGSTEYCLSLFHSDPARAGKLNFHSYYFNFPDD